jgi:hypothetical protein
MAYLATGAGIATPDAAHVGGATADPANVPTTGATGWPVDEIPPRQWFNWAFKWIAKWIRYFDYKIEATIAGLITVSAEFSQTITFTGPTGSPTATLTGKKLSIPGTPVVSEVHLVIPRLALTMGSTTSIVATAALPSGFRPPSSEANEFIVPCRLVPTPGPGTTIFTFAVISIGSSGDMTLLRLAADAEWDEVTFPTGHIVSIAPHILTYTL